MEGSIFVDWSDGQSGLEDIGIGELSWFNEKMDIEK